MVHVVLNVMGLKEKDAVIRVSENKTWLQQLAEQFAWQQNYKASIDNRRKVYRGDTEL